MLPFIVVCIFLTVKNAICLSLLEAKWCIVDIRVMLNIELLFLYVILFLSLRNVWHVFATHGIVSYSEGRQKP